MGRKIVTAIDAGSSKMTTVIATIDDDSRVPTVIGVHNPPSRGIKNGVVVNIEEATDSIAESVTAAEKMAGITVSDVYITINGGQISSINNKGVVAVSTGNDITEEDTLRAIENAKTISLPANVDPIHIIPREFVVDNQGGIKYPIGMTGVRLEVETHIITTPMSSWQNLVKCVQEFGLTVNDIVFTGWASSLAVLTDTEKELGVTMIDIGAGTASISIFQDGSICYSGCVPLGGQSLTSDIAIGLQVSLEEAEKIKVNMGELLAGKLKLEKEDSKTPALLRKTSVPKEINNKDNDLIDISVLGIASRKTVSKSMLNKIVEARLEEIFDMLAKEVEQAGFDMASPAGIVITGGTALFDSVTKVAKGIFGVPVRIGYPSGLSGMVEEITDPIFSSVQGLIKHAMDDEIGLEDQGSSSLSKVGDVVSKVSTWFKSLMP